MARRPWLPLAAVLCMAAALGGCGSFRSAGPAAQLSEQECLARAMYFESNRSSDDGMLAVGSVVMNRLQDRKYPKTICGVVGQERQFADGALTKHLDKRSKSWERATRVADAVIAGERHGGVGVAMHFHTLGYSYPYRNMRYVTLAGGNIFYEKRNPEPGAPAWPSASQFARRSVPAEREPAVMMAALRPRPEPAEVRTSRPEPVRAYRPASSEPRIVLAAAEPPPSRRAAAAAPAVRTATTPSGSGRAATPPAKPIVLAMADAPRPRSTAHKPRSIEELIAADLAQQ